MMACPLVSMPVKELQLAITNITVSADTVNLSWADYSGRTDFASLYIDSAESLGIMNWTKITNVAPNVSSVNVSADTSTKFFRLFASLISKVLVTFDSNGGATPTLFAEKEFDIGAPYELPTTTRSGGYSFINWFTAQTGGDAVIAGTLVENTAAHTLWAQWFQNPVEWMPNPYSITVTNTPSASASFTVPTATGDEVDFTYGVAGMLPSADWGFNGGSRQVTVGQNVMPGGPYSFNLSAEPSNGLPATNLTVNVEVKRQIMVAFDGNGGTTPAPFDEKAFIVGALYELPTTTRDGGYSFVNWFTAQTGGNAVTAGSLVQNTASHTLWAQWSQNPVSWTPNPYSVTVTNTPSAPAYFTVPTATGDGVDFTYDVDGVLPSADWSFNAGNGQVTVGQNVLQGSYSFKLSAEPSNGLPATNLTVNVEVKRQVTVSFDAGVGSASFGSKSVIVGEAYGTMATASASGWTFFGWWTESQYGTQADENARVAATSDHTVYARWASYLTAPANVVIQNNVANGVTIPAATVSPANAVLTFTYNGLSYKSGVSGQALPSGTGSSGAAWAMSFNTGNRQVSVPQGTSVGRYQLYGTVNVSGTTFAQTMTSPTFTVEVREEKTYWYNTVDVPPDRCDFDNRGNFLNKTSEDYNSYARATASFTSQDKVFYPKVKGIGNEQPAYVRSLGATVNLGLRLSYSNNNNYWNIYAWNDTTVLRTSLVNNIGSTSWTKYSVDITSNGLGRGHTSRLELAGHGERMALAGSTLCDAAWGNLVINWAPPATGITY